MGTRKTTVSEQRQSGAQSARRKARKEKAPASARQPALPGLDGALFADGPAPLAVPLTALGAAVALVRPADVAPASHLPMHGHASVRECFGELRAALAEGWEIVQPIFARPLWSVTDDSITAFNFVLRRERATRLVTVPQGRSVERFIRDRHLAVDYRH